MNYEKMTKAELISKLKSLESSIENSRCKEELSTLHGSEEQYRAVFDQLADSLVIVDGDTGKILEFNDRAHQSLGYSREEFKELTLADIDALESHMDVKVRIEKIKRYGTHIFESKHKTKTGEVREVLISTRALSIQGKNIISSIWHDITKQKQTEKDLRKKNSYLKLLQVAAAAANEAVEIKDAFQPVLEEICSYTGWEIGHAYIISKDDPDLLEPTSVWRLKNHNHFKEFCYVSKDIKFFKGSGLPGRVLANGKPHWIIDVTKDKNFLRTKIAKAVNIKSGIAFPVMVGSTVVAVMTFFTTREEEPDQPFMEIMADVGTQLGRAVERKQAVGILVKSEERYRSLINDVLDTSNVGVFILDKNFRVVWINKAMELFFGIERDKVIMEDKRRLVSNKICHIFEEADTFKERVLRTYDDNTYVESFACHISSGNGREERWLEHWSQPIVSGLYAGGRVEHYTDITKRKQAEEALLQSEKMKAMGIMTAGVAHEFNNILAVISSNAQLLEETNKNDKELSKSLRTICRMSDDGAEIVDRMYDFTNVNKDTSRYVSVDLHDLIKQVIGFTMPRWKEMAQADGITYQIVWDGAKVLPSVLGNPSELREVILNIINNALDAMPDGGTVTVAAQCIRLPAARLLAKRRLEGKLKSDFVEISIADSGKGMSEEVKKKLFDPFFTTRSPQGTGLGMSISYGIITRHGGKINVESELGKGCVISLTLPVTNKSIPHVVTSIQDSKSNVDGLKILLVDDKKEICESLGKIFTDDGHKVCSINNGVDAIKLLKKNRYDLLICDLVMPDVNGRDIVNAIRTMNNRPKVGLITGWRYKIEDAEKDGLEVDFIVKKPFNLSRLRRDINDLWS